MPENVHLEILSVQDLVAEDRIRRLGIVIDAFDDLKPELAGPRDPPRTRVASVAQHLVDWQSIIRPGDYYTQLFARNRQPPRTYGTLQVTGDIWNFPPYAAHSFDYGVHEEWLDQESNADRFADFFARAAEALDAFWGAAGLTSLLRQANDILFRARVAGTLVWPGMPGTGWDVRERAVPDVYWLNYFGPSLLSHWGAARLDGVGVRQRTTENGGLVVWSTASPFVFDPGARSLTSYAWKQPFYDALEPDTFLHEHWRDPGLGVRVPTYEGHRDAPRSSSVKTDVRFEALGSLPSAERLQRVSPSPDVVQAVGALRPLGFFAGRTGSDEDVAAELVGDHRASWGRDPVADEGLLDLELLRFDPDRVWWEDTEADVDPGNDAYVTAVCGWAAISRGALDPTAVSETWDSATGPVRIRLVQDGREHELVARYLDDYLDMSVLDGLNRIIADSPYRFLMVTPFDQTAFILVCDERERRLLEARGWSFAT